MLATVFEPTATAASGRLRHVDFRILGWPAQALPTDIALLVLVQNGHVISGRAGYRSRRGNPGPLLAARRGAGDQWSGRRVLTGKPGRFCARSHA